MAAPTVRYTFSELHTVVDGYNLSMTVSIYSTETVRHNINFTFNKSEMDRSKKYGAANREELNTKARDKYNSDPEPDRLRRKVYYDHHKDEEYERFINWRKQNPDRYRELKLREYDRRSEWGIEPLNKYFEGAHFHHLHINDNHSIGVYIPPELHKSLWHSYSDIDTMNEINKLSLEWLLESEAYIMTHKINEVAL